jgi:NADPH:quinone reductase-like Zn-dependent oxidoreductase
MLALVNTPNGNAPVELRQVPEPVPSRHDALVAVQAFSLNRLSASSFEVTSAPRQSGRIWPGLPDIP